MQALGVQIGMLGHTVQGQAIVAMGQAENAFRNRGGLTHARITQAGARVAELFSERATAPSARPGQQMSGSQMGKLDSDQRADAFAESTGRQGVRWSWSGSLA